MSITPVFPAYTPDLEVGQRIAIYAGKRRGSSVKFVHMFVVEETGEKLYFRNHEKCSIGARYILTDKGENTYNFKYYNHVQKGKPYYESVTQWSVDERVAFETEKVKKIMETPMPNDVETLIDKIQESIAWQGFNHRKRIALYVFERLLK